MTRTVAADEELRKFLVELDRDVYQPIGELIDEVETRARLVDDVLREAQSTGLLSIAQRDRIGASHKAFDQKLRAVRGVMAANRRSARDWINRLIAAKDPLDA